MMLRIPHNLKLHFGVNQGERAGRQRVHPRCRPMLMELENRQLLSLMALASFNGMPAYGPEAGVIMDSSGNLYGTTPDLGVNAGTIFELAHGSSTITTLFKFNDTNGDNPEAGVIMDSSGDLYGTTEYGGAFGYGTVFELAHGSSKITTLASFNPTTSGGAPEAGVIMDSSGDLYGTTSNGGAKGYGTIFELTHGSSTITALAPLGQADAGVGGPVTGVVMDSSGNLYGTENAGGPDASGIIFELAHGSSKITTLASFNVTNGESPQAGVIIDSSGDLFGTTEYGGANHEGTIFELAHGSSTITVLASFNGTNGLNPIAGVTMDSSGNLYGTTPSGGTASGGTLFELAHGSTITTLASFTGTTGYDPSDALIMDSSGNLYGTTQDGGASSYGTVFEYTLPVISVTAPSFDDTSGGVDFGYTISNANLSQATTIALYWASGTTFDTVIGDPIFSTMSETAQGNYPIYVTPDEMGTIPEGAKYLLAVANPESSPIISSLDLSGGIGTVYTNIVLPDVTNILPHGAKPTDDVRLHYKSIGLTFTTNSTVGTSETSDALSNYGTLPVSILDQTTGKDFPLGTSTAQVEVTVFGPVEASQLSANGEFTPGTVNIGPLGIGYTEPNNIFLGGSYTPGDAVLRWTTSGFSVQFLQVLIPNFTTPPLTFWVDLDKLGIDPADYSFQHIVDIAEPFIHTSLSQTVFSGHPLLPFYADILLLPDPGDTSLQTTDPQNNETGLTANGTLVNNIPGSIYIPSIPMVVIINPVPGIYQTRITSIDSGGYELDTELANYSQTLSESVVSGNLPASEESITYFTNVNDLALFINTTQSPPISAEESGLVYNRSTQLFGGTITLTNNGTTPLTGTLEVELTGLPAGVTLANASGIAADGNPYILINLANYSFAGGQSINFTVLFADPTKTSFQYGIMITNEDS